MYCTLTNGYGTSHRAAGVPNVPFCVKESIENHCCRRSAIEPLM